MEILAVRDLTFYYPETVKPALENLSLTVNSGDFLTLCGYSGCGKTTLLRHLKPQLAPHGALSGEILFKGIYLKQLDARESASQIGFVLQSPDNQLVTDKVWHEMAFGLESLGLDTPTVRRRVAETASFFGIQNWFYKNVSELSGGQKQLLNLAAVMVMQPELLILDEPTSQLDPIAASEFLLTLKKINTELGTTVILIEHRLEEALPISNRAAVMESGKLLCTGAPSDIGEYLKAHNHGMFCGFPAAVRIWGAIGSKQKCPVSVNEGRKFVYEYTKENALLPLSEKTQNTYGGVKLNADGIFYRYEKDLPDAVKNLKLSVHAGEKLCILGGNGTGKTTALKLLSGIYKPYRGEVKINGKIGLLPQNPQTLFVKKTVYEDLSDMLSDVGLTVEVKRERIESSLKQCRLIGLENRHPYDLSGGEQQRLALAKLLLTEPDILLLDEPTKGLDARLKAELADILTGLAKNGAAIVTVSHDVEFCADFADRCALFFDGNIAAEGTPQEFFCGNSFYTTAANRIARDIIPNAVTVDDVITAFGGKTAKKTQRYDTANISDTVITDPETAAKKLPLWRKASAAVSGLISFIIFVYAVKSGDLSSMTDSGGITSLGRKQLLIYGIFILFLVLTAALIGGKSKPPAEIKTPKQKRRLSRRTAAAVVIILLLVPLTLFGGLVYLDRKQYYLTATAVLIECMCPFFMIFEGRRPKTRELTVIAVLCALSIAGRAAFFMLPQFKPVLAMTVIAGVALGAETGFLVGAVTMLVSNILFSQGPWTPWQMFAMGIIGFLAGILYKKGLLSRTRLSLSIFGAICAVVIYGGIMNPASVLIWSSETLNVSIILSCYITGFPMDLIHAAATAIFLWFIAEPMIEKLDRIKVKYGLTE